MPNRKPLTAAERLERAQEKIQASYARMMEAKKLRDEGQTLQKVGDALGVSRERARQLIEQAEREIAAQ